MKQFIVFLFFLVAATHLLANDSVKFALYDSPLIDAVIQDQIDNPQGYQETTNILRSVDIKIDGDLVTEHIQQIWYYPDSTSADDFGTESLYFNETSDVITVFSAASVSSNQSVSQLDISTVQYGEDDNYNTFNDRKIVYLPIPGVVEKSYTIIDYTITTDYSKTEMPFYGAFSVSSNFLIKSFKVHAEWRNQDIRWDNTYTDLECQVTGESLSCIASNIAPLDMDSSTYWRDKAHVLVLAAKQNWSDVIKQMSDAYEHAFTEQTLVEDLYNELTEGLVKKEDIINALFHYVSEQIRYVSLSTEGHGYTPHSNDSVINNRFGDCKDKTALLQALLKRAGIEATPQLVATNRTNPDQLNVPSSAYFNHIILCLNDNGKEYCLDPTDVSTHWQTTSEWIQNKVTLALQKNEKPKQILPADYRWKIEINTEFTFTAEGGLLERQQRTYFGEFAAYMRDQLRGKNNKDQQEWLKEQYQQNIADIESVEFDITSGLEDNYDTLELASSTTFEPFLTIDTHLEYTESDNWLASELRSHKLENKFDAYTFKGVKYISHYVVDMSSHWIPKKPSPSLNLTSRFGELKRKSNVENDKLYIETTLKIPFQIIELEDQNDFNKFLKALNELQTIRVEAPLGT